MSHKTTPTAMSTKDKTSPTAMSIAAKERVYNNNKGGMGKE